VAPQRCSRGFLAVRYNFQGGGHQRDLVELLLRGTGSNCILEFLPECALRSPYSGAQHLGVLQSTYIRQRVVQEDNSPSASWASLCYDTRTQYARHDDAIGETVCELGDLGWTPQF